MSENSGSFELIVREIGILLKPLADVLTPEEIRKVLFVDVGVDVPAIALDQTGLRDALAQVSTAATQLPSTIAELTTALDANDVVGAAQKAMSLGGEISATIGTLDQIVAALRQLSGSLPGVTEEQIGGFAGTLAARLLELLAIK